MTKPMVVVTIAIAGTLLSSCGEDQAAEQQQQQQESATRELQQAQRELRKERRRLTREREKDEPSESSPDESSSDTPSGSDKGKVPDVDGEDHQLAQDKMQAAGFYNLSEEDASGEDRPLLYDRNWTVVSQSPKAGTRASLDRTIVLKAKKDGE